MSVMSAVDAIREREEGAKQEALNLLREQLKVEGELVALYSETAPEIENKAVMHLLEMVALDSRKHIAICQAAIEVLEGEDVLSEDKPAIIEGLQRHLELEEDAIRRADELLKNVWIRENKALNEMIRKLRDDERRHIETMRKLSEKPFFRFEPGDLTVVMRGVEFAEERYRRERDYRERQKKE
jgi:rubrerythrin